MDGEGLARLVKTRNPVYRMAVYPNLVTDGGTQHCVVFNQQDAHLLDPALACTMRFSILRLKRTLSAREFGLQAGVSFRLQKMGLQSLQEFKP